MRKMLNFFMAVIVFATMVIGAGQAHAVLQALGPVSQLNGYPLWYQDTNNLTLTLCLDQNGFCVIDPLQNPLPADRTDIDATNFPEESFYYMAETSGTGGGISLGLYEAAVEAGFIGAVIDGGQAAFTRIRIRADVNAIGTYTVTHPYGVKSFNVTALVAGDEINDTVDVPGLVLQPFNQQHQSLAGNPPALPQDVGPFLTRADGQTVTDPANPSNRYIGNPNVAVAVTGSPTGNNFVRIVGPNGTLQVNNFTLMGKIIGLAITPQAAQLGTDFEFWKLGPNPTSAKAFAVENLSQDPITLALTAVVPGSNPVVASPDFAIVPGTCGQPVAAGAVCTFNVTINPTANGATSATIIVADSANPASVPPATVTVVGHGDSNPPIVTIDGAATQFTNLTSIVISGTYTDIVNAIPGAGVASVDVAGDVTNPGPAALGTLTDTWSEQVTLANLDGPNTITVTATDLAQGTPPGNTSAPVNVIIIQDSTIPTVAINAPTSPTNTNSQLISGTADDANGIGTVNIAVNGADQGLAVVTGNTWSFTVTNLAPITPNAIVATAVDPAGNQASANASITFTPPADGRISSLGAAEPSITDALMALRHAVNLIVLTPEQFAHGDVAPLDPVTGIPNPNGVVDIADALVILRRVVGLITTF
jgi:hypothetical protein